jgi:hypothetical protein
MRHVRLRILLGRRAIPALEPIEPVLRIEPEQQRPILPLEELGIDSPLIAEHRKRALLAPIARAQMGDVLPIARRVEPELGDQRLGRERVVGVNGCRQQHDRQRREQHDDRQ